MSTFITTSANSKTGYKLVIKDGDKIVKTYEIDSTDPKNESILKLPENPSNRKWLSVKKVTEAGGELELTYKASIVLGERSTSSKLEDYMTEEEKKIIADIQAKAEARREEAKKKAAEAKKDPVKKAKAKVESAIDALKALGMSDEAIAKLIKGGRA